MRFDLSDLKKITLHLAIPSSIHLPIVGLSVNELSGEKVTTSLETLLAAKLFLQANRTRCTQAPSDSTTGRLPT